MREAVEAEQAALGGEREACSWCMSSWLARGAHGPEAASRRLEGYLVMGFNAALTLIR